MRALALGAVLAVALPSCSLLGLDHLEPSTCMPGTLGDAFCETLASVRPTGDACHRWQCGTESHHCELEPLDLDADDAPAAGCEPATVTPDCHDDEHDNRPGGTETCDGLDNDCNELVDDGAVAGGALLALRDLPGDSLEPVFGRAPDADELVAAVVTPTPGGAEVSVVLDVASTRVVTTSVRTVGGTAIAPTGVTAIEGLGANRYALLFEIAAGSCQRTLLGILDTPAMTIRVDDAHAPVGFPNLAGDCTMGATSTGALARDPESADLLVGYLEARPRDCETATPAPVLVTSAPRAVPAAGATALELGESIDARPPAMLSLGDDTFLVAFPTMAGTIEVHRVSAAVSPVTAELVYTDPAEPGLTRGDVRLFAGPTTGGTTEVAMTYASGCGDAPVGMRLLSVAASGVTAGGRVEGTAATGARVPVAVYQPMLDEWLLAWRTRRALGGARFARDATPIGGGFALVVEENGYETPIAVFAPGRTSAYRGLSARTDAGTRTAFAFELGCVPPVESP